MASSSMTLNSFYNVTYHRISAFSIDNGAVCLSWVAMQTISQLCMIMFHALLLFYLILLINRNLWHLFFKYSFLSFQEDGCNASIIENFTTFATF